MTRSSIESVRDRLLSLTIRKKGNSRQELVGTAGSLNSVAANPATNASGSASSQNSLAPFGHSRGPQLKKPSKILLKRREMSGAGGGNRTCMVSLMAVGTLGRKWGATGPSCYHNLVRITCLNRKDIRMDATPTGRRHQTAST